MERILIVDDDLELCRLVEKFLTREGFEIESVHNGEKGLVRALSGEHSLVVLDVMLPELNGLDVLRNLRKTSPIPVLMLTARGEDLDRIIGLEIGADDYLPKPFNPRELVARLRAILRRLHPVEQVEAVSKLILGDLEIDEGTRTVRRNGDLIDLTSAEFNILFLLGQNAGKIVKREQLAEIALGRKLSPFDRSIDNLVSKLRKKIGRQVGEIERIKPIRNTGYMYVRLNKTEENL
jgi:two-component system, OmpR family, response regulator CpxR